MEIHKKIDIISFTAHKTPYYGASLTNTEWMPDHYLRHTEIDIPLGHSRYGGPVIDVPEGFVHPENLRFAGQLGLEVFSPFDSTGLLPRKGQLYFFFDLRTDTGKILYADVATDALQRVVVEHEDHFFLGILVDQIFASTESFEERFRPVEYGEEKYAEENGLMWESFAGSERSKVFGIYTHCQYGYKDIEDIAVSDKILLLQIGENGFNDDGVFSVLIPKSDLEKLDFSNCEFAWG